MTTVAIWHVVSDLVFEDLRLGCKIIIIIIIFFIIIVYYYIS